MNTYSGYELFTKKKAAELLAISTTTLWRAIRRGQVHTVKVGNSEYIPFAEIKRLQDTEGESEARDG